MVANPSTLGTQLKSDSVCDQDKSLISLNNQLKPDQCFNGPVTDCLRAAGGSPFRALGTGEGCPLFRTLGPRNKRDYGRWEASSGDKLGDQKGVKTAVIQSM